MALSVTYYFICEKVRADRQPFSHICGKMLIPFVASFFGFYELTELATPLPQLDEIRDTDFYAYYRQ